MAEPIFQFEDFEIHCGRFQLLRKGRPLRIEPKPLELLILLVSRKGDLVTRREIVEKLWTSDVFVDTDHGINTAIRKLRYLLRDDPESPKFIETVTGMGYRFVATVSDSPESTVERPDQRQPAIPATPLSATSQSAQPSPDPASVRPASTAFYAWIVAAAVVIVLLVVAGWYLTRPLPVLRVVSYTQITRGGGRKNPVGIDGSMLYFNGDGDDPIYEVSVGGGEGKSIHVDLPAAGLAGVLENQSALLVGSNDGKDYSIWKVQVPGGSKQRIVHHVLIDGRDLLSDAQNIAASPDGLSIAFITNQGDVVVVDTDGSHVRRLLVPPKSIPDASGSDVAWSPDGKKLRFTWNHQYWEASSDGSALHPIHPDWRPGVWQCCGQWTADGNHFVFVAPDSSAEMPLPYGQLWAFDEHRGFFTHRPRDPIQLTTGPIRWAALAVNRHTQNLFAEGVVFRGELVRYDPSAHELRPFLHGISAEYLDYSPDGKSIIYVTFPEGILWRADRDGANPVQLTSPPLYPINPLWSPDGSRILFFTMGFGEPRRAYLVSAQGGDPVQLSSANHPTDMLDPVWAPDGSRIAFGTSGSENAPQADIEILDLTTHQSVKVKGSEGMWSPRWSPDGRYIAALDSKWSLTLFDTQSQTWKTLAEGACSYPTWSRDSRKISYTRVGDNGAIYQISLAGGKPAKAFTFQPISYTGALNTWFGLDPDGIPIMFRDAGSDEIYSLTLNRK